MTDDRRYTRSRELLARALGHIPDGTQTLSKAAWAFPGDGAPAFIERGDGGHVWDVDGNRFLDLMNALLPILLGYRDPDVDKAIRRQLDRGIVFSLPSPLECELAELLVDTIPCAEMVRFGKSGTDVTTAAVRLARAATGRERVALCGYHGWNDWSVATTTRPDGVPAAVGALSHTFPFNDLSALEGLLELHPGEFAAVIIEPARTAEPAPGYLSAVRDLAHRHGALLVFDEIATGFRLHPGGAQAHYGVTPDLAAFGKGMANGMPLSALVGPAAIMRTLGRVFFSSTFGGETLSLAAAIATVTKIRECGVCDHLARLGSILGRRVEAAIDGAGLTGAMALGGPVAMPHLVFHGVDGASALALKTVFMREMIARGVLITGFNGLCFAHNEADIEEAAAAYEESLAVLADEIRRGDLDNRLGAARVRPVFQPAAGRGQ